MNVSDFFHTLHTSYQAELDDLSLDSEGRNVLRQRLLEKRSQIAFLRQMIEISPEMVAVVFHGGFHFELPVVMDHLLALEPEEFPDWERLADAVQLAPWAQELADHFLQEPQGAWFMTVAAALEYLHQRPSLQAHAHPEHHDTEVLHERRATHRRDHDHGHDFDADDEHHHRHDHDHEESSADWLASHGFDRKD